MENSENVMIAHVLVAVDGVRDADLVSSSSDRRWARYAFLLNVLAPTVRWFTMRAPTQSQFARWRSPSNVLLESR